MAIRTDLALESASDFSGMHQVTRGKWFQITDIRIDTDAHGAAIGKPKGRYLTLETTALHRHNPHFQQLAEELAKEFSIFLPKSSSVLIAGLGNRSITPDALGCLVAERLFVTRHLQKELSETEYAPFADLRSVSAIAPGVMGQTGMEAAELLSAICQKTKPDCVIVIDALACAALERLGTTIQICDSGIAPGSGVENCRKEISHHTLQTPVIAVGVPTVVDLHTAAEGLLHATLPPVQENMIVTPREIDQLIQNAADLLICGLHLALYPQLEFEEIISLL